MLNLTLRTTATLVAALTLSRGATEAELSFHPAKDSRARKEFSESVTWRITELTQLLNGEPVTGPTPEITGSSEREWVALDQYVELATGRPKRLDRKFEKLRGQSRLDFEVSGMSENVATPLVSPLEGVSVEFDCSEESACKARFAEGSTAPSTLLDGLAEDLDLRALLPLEDVGVEDRWTIDAALLARVLAPGGKLALGPERGSIAASELLDPLEIATTVLCALSETSEELSGEVEALWRETREDDGRALAVIELEWKSAAKCDASKRALELMEAADAPTQRKDCALEFAVDSEGRGELVWDLAAGRAHAFELELESTLACEMLWSEGPVRMGYRFKVGAQSKLEASFETP